MRLTSLAIALGALFAVVAPAQAESCVQCHGDKARLLKVVNNDETLAARNFVDLEKIQKSVHGQQACDECHFEFDRYPHPKETETAGCADCHDDAGSAHASSVHGTAKVGDSVAGGRPVGCADCHGVHDILKPDARASKLHPLNVTRTCGTCHFEGIDAATATVDELLKQPYCDDTHGHGLLRGGLTVSPTCVSCHGGHDTRKKGDPTSRVSRKNVSQTCAVCHVGVLEQYQLSVHSVARENGEDAAATCTDCHPPHTSDVSTPGFRVASVKRCGVCHEQKMDSFRSSYHGKVTSLGYGGKVADCAGCHGAHSIRKGDDPHSRIHPDNLVKTCAECHPKAHAAFVDYKVHAVWDGESEDSDPFLYVIYASIHGLLIGVMIFGFAHIALWLVRATIAGDWKHRARGGRTLRRWRPFYVQLHVVFMCSFILLAGTGLPLHYAGQEWARRLMLRFGGPEAAGWVHRVAAITMLACIGVYLIHIGHRYFVRKEKGLWTGPNTMLPRWKDVTDFVGNFRWFLFLGKRPKYDRWAYWEKFDFWAVFWGIVIIGGTGLVLWFPEQATYVLPGWFINVSTIVHGHEALLAVAFIFTFHIFHANLRPDKFPMDPLFLTGRMPEEEMKHDRPMEYERAQNEGTLDAMEDREPMTATVRVAYILGMLVMISGIVLVILMFSVAD
jgi:cytochrome b subunit of formate dehydrogenase